jgi:hypothetical protein
VKAVSAWPKTVLAGDSKTPLVTSRPVVIPVCCRARVNRSLFGGVTGRPDYVQGGITMSAPPVTPGQPSSAQYQPADSPGGRDGFADMIKLAKRLALACGVLAALFAGIVIGNTARKRIDRMSHGIQ